MLDPYKIAVKVSNVMELKKVVDWYAKKCNNKTRSLYIAQPTFFIRIDMLQTTITLNETALRKGW